MNAVMKATKPKVNTKKVPRYIAVHEAGHVVGAWYVGQSTDETRVQSRASKRTGEFLVTRKCITLEKSLGFADLSHYVIPKLLVNEFVETLPRDDQEELYRMARRDIISLLAGPIAQVRLSRKDRASILLFNGGSSDYEKAAHIARNLPEGESIAIDFAYETGKKIVSKHWSTILAIADKLQANLKLDDHEIEPILMATTGEGWRDFMCPMEWEFDPINNPLTIPERGITRQIESLQRFVAMVHSERMNPTSPMGSPA